MQRTGNASFDAAGLRAMAAGNGKTNGVAFFNLDAWMNVNTLESPDHICLTGIGKGAIVFTQMASQTPFFIDKNTFHRAPPLLAGILNAQNGQFFFV